MKHARAISVITAGIIVVVIFTALLYPSIKQMTTQGSTTSPGSTVNTPAATAFHTSVTNSTNNLEFTLQLTSDSNGSLSIKVDELNLLDSVNTVTDVDGWNYPFSLNPFNNCPIGFLDGFAVVSGYYAKDNFSVASPLRLYNATEGQFSCSSNSYGGTYSFQPMSDVIALYGTNAVKASVADTVSGYWSSTGSSFQPFPPGVYTVIGADQWGNVLLMHFTVSAGQIEIQTTGTTASSSSSGTSSAIGTASTSNASAGLQFGLQVVPGGNGTFIVTAKEVNLLSSVNNVTAADGWKYPADQLDPFNNCAPGVDPVGFAIFQGFYGMNNYTSGEALPLYNTTIEESCTVNFYPNEDLFQPLSDNISVYNDGQFRTNSTASVSLLASGYWTGGQGTSAPVAFHGFSGAYTVIGADTWGNVLLLHFSVAIGTTSEASASASDASSSQQSVTCTISGQPGPMFLRVVSDSNQTPIAGAQVSATNDPAYCGNLPASTQTTVTFTTSHTEWYSLNSENNAGYSFMVEYSGHTYNFTARLAPVSATCSTLFIPSGRTNVSILGFQTDSTACTSTTTSSSSSQQYASLSWDSNYGVWNYEVTLTTNQIQQGQNINAIFSLTNFSNQTQTIDVASPLAAAQSITQQIVLPTGMLIGGQPYTLRSYPAVITPDIGQYMELNQTITVG